MLRKVKLHPGGDSFSESIHFNDEQKKRLAQHFSRLHGTLIFWKNQSEKFKRYHIYTICWSVTSLSLIPILTQSVTQGDYSKLFLTVMSTHAVVVLGFHRAFKVEDNFKAFRHGESHFYDLYRRLLDRPETFGNTPEEQINTYLIETEKLRGFIRNAETNNLATIDDLHTKHEKFSK